MVPSSRYPSSGLGLIALLLVAGPLGCGGDAQSGPSLTGFYDITRHTLTQGTCEGEGTDVPDSVVLRLVQGNLFGVTVLQGYVCAAAEGCGEGDDFATWSFFERRGATWVTEASTSSEAQGDCLLTYTSSTLEAVEGGVHLQSTFSSGSFPLTGDACDPDAVDSRRDQLTCDQVRILEATSAATE